MGISNKMFIRERQREIDSEQKLNKELSWNRLTSTKKSNKSTKKKSI